MTDSNFLLRTLCVMWYATLLNFTEWQWTVYRMHGLQVVPGNLSYLKKKMFDAEKSVLFKLGWIQTSTLFNPIALRMAKTQWSFGYFECSGLKNWEVYCSQKAGDKKIKKFLAKQNLSFVKKIILDGVRSVCKHYFFASLTLVLLNQDRHYLWKQCRSRSDGFFRSHLIRIYTVFHSVYELI